MVSQHCIMNFMDFMICSGQLTFPILDMEYRVRCCC